jgi:hypothetical protein
MEQIIRYRGFLPDQRGARAAGSQTATKRNRGENKGCTHEDRGIPRLDAEGGFPRRRALHYLVRGADMGHQESRARDAQLLTFQPHIARRLDWILTCPTKRLFGHTEILATAASLRQQRWLAIWLRQD